MAKNNTAPAETQIQINPQVSITYSPEKQVLALGNNALHVLARLQELKPSNLKTLEETNQALNVGGLVLDEIAEVRDALATRVKDAFEPYKRFPLFEGSEINITMTIPLRQKIENAFRAAKQSRANYLAAEQERVRRENLAKQVEQDRINAEAAKKAAAEAKKQGADKQTVADIKMAVMETPAPTVTSKALDAATSTVRYSYSAKITDLKKFLGTCLQNEALFNTLQAAVPEIEKAFRGMASAQKEAFNYAGITFKKTAIDVGKRAF